MIPTALTYDFVRSLYLQKGFVFEEANEHANLFGYRSKDLAPDHFNDIIGVVFKDFFGNKQCLVFPGTTKPGMHYLKDELGNPKGTFIMAPGQHMKCWTPGLHNGKYQAFIQSAPNVFKGWRDLTLDGKLDMAGPIYSDTSGVDGHTTRFDINVTDVVANFSAGCQVLRDDKHFEIWLNAGLRSLEVTGEKAITYTLFQES